LTPANLGAPSDDAFPMHSFDETPDVTVVVVSYNTAHLLRQMLAALADGRGALKLQVIVVDNASG